MICIKCFHEKTIIINSRGRKKYPTTWRRHLCPQCNNTFTTHEGPVLEQYSVITSSGEIAPFSVSKLILSIARSFQHDTRAAEFDSYHIAQTIQMSLFPKMTEGKPLPASYIVAMIVKVLERYDPIAALQYRAQHGLGISRRRK